MLFSKYLLNAWTQFEVRLFSVKHKGRFTVSDGVGGGGILSGAPKGRVPQLVEVPLGSQWKAAQNGRTRVTTLKSDVCLEGVKLKYFTHFFFFKSLS